MNFLRYFFIGALFGTLFVRATARGGDSDVTRSVRPFLFANYYTWYQDGDHPTEPWAFWSYDRSKTNANALRQQRKGEPPPSSKAFPLAGLYDSADPQVAEWHVQLAQSCGIDAFLVDWWASHSGFDLSMENGILKAVEKRNFRFALLDERAQFHEDFEWYQDAVTTALTKYKDHPSYLRIDGRPVWYLYQTPSKPGLTPTKFLALKQHVEERVGGVYWMVNKLTHNHAAAAAGDSARVKTIPTDWLATEGIDSFGFYGTFSHLREFKYEQLAPKYRYLVELVHGAGKKMLLPVHPGHDNSNFRDDPFVMPRRNGDTLREYLRAATDAQADFIMITSWNEWPETTVIEPSTSWEDPYLYLKIVAEWKGIDFEIPANPFHGGDPPNPKQIGAD